MGHDGHRLDPRTALAFMCLLGVVALAANRPVAAHAACGIATLFALFAGAWRPCLILAPAYAAMSGLMVWAEAIDNTTAVLAIIMLGYIAQKLIVMALLGCAFAGLTAMPGVLAGLQALRVPRAVLIPVMVMLRFFPTIREDARHLMESLKTRRIAASPLQVVRHPVRMGEYVVVPLLMRSAKVADELAASALARGLDLRSAPTPVYPLGFTWRDFAFLLVTIAAACALLWLQFGPR